LTTIKPFKLHFKEKHLEGTPQAQHSLPWWNILSTWEKILSIPCHVEYKPVLMTLYKQRPYFYYYWRDVFF
jgi:hypothetical protein